MLNKKIAKRALKKRLFFRQKSNKRLWNDEDAARNVSNLNDMKPLATEILKKMVKLVHAIWQ